MKFSINRDYFDFQVNHVIRAIPSKTTFQILKGLKIEVTEEGITLIGSDSEMSIVSFISIDSSIAELQIEEPGDIVVGARLFSEIIKKLPTNMIHFSTNEHNLLTIQSGTAVFTLNGESAEEYPQLPEIDQQQQIELPAYEFKQMVAHTIFATSNQENRPILTGLNLTLNENKLISVATDSHRLSREVITVEINKPINHESITIPKKTMNELVRIVSDDEPLYLVLTDKQVVFISSSMTIYSGLLDNVYPDTDSLIPKSYTTELVVNATEFSHVIDRASLISHQSLNNVVQLNLSSDKVEVSVKSNERGQVIEAVKYEEANGNPLRISFNPDYMKDALQSFGNRLVRIQFQTPSRPMLILPVEPSETDEDTKTPLNLLQLLTPMRSH